METEKRIPIFSTATLSGVFLIDAPESLFQITWGGRIGAVYRLWNERDPSFVTFFENPYQAICVVAQHRTGITEWDLSTETVSDYAPDWERHVDKKFQMRLIGDFLAKRPEASMREMVDYFEHKHPYFIERSVIKSLLIELVTTGQVDKLPDFQMAPAEMARLKRIAEHWEVETK